MKVKETEQFVRNPYIAEATKRRANGICQLCRKAALFTRLDGNPYLESHHIIWLSEGGSDSYNITFLQVLLFVYLNGLERWKG